MPSLAGCVPTRASSPQQPWVLQAGLYPGASIGNPELGTGCFGVRETIPTGRLNRGMAFGWEAVMTFVLVATVCESFIPLILHAVPCANTPAAESHVLYQGSLACHFLEHFGYLQDPAQ